VKKEDVLIGLYVGWLVLLVIIGVTLWLFGIWASDPTTSTHLLESAGVMGALFGATVIIPFAVFMATDL
jgi:hypothetical protein